MKNNETGNLCPSFFFNIYFIRYGVKSMGFAIDNTLKTRHNDSNL